MENFLIHFECGSAPAASWAVSNQLGRRRCVKSHQKPRIAFYMLPEIVLAYCRYFENPIAIQSTHNSTRSSTYIWATLKSCSVRKRAHLNSKSVTVATDPLKLLVGRFSDSSLLLQPTLGFITSFIHLMSKRTAEDFNLPNFLFS